AGKADLKPCEMTRSAALEGCRIAGRPEGLRYVSQVSTPAVATPIGVTGPVAATSPLRDPAHGYPFNATPMDLAKQGYVEEEFFIQGSASRYATPQMATGTVTDAGHPYKTRIVVRRPKSAPRFN